MAKAAATIVDVVGSGRVTHIPWPEGRSKQETGGYVTDISKIKTTLGWSPGISFEEGVHRTAEYYRRYNSHYW